MTKLEKAFEAVKLRMESAKPYHNVWSDEFLVIEELLNREVVLRKDVEELVGTLQWVHEAVRNSNMEMIRKHNVERHIKQALAKFTTKPKEGM